MRRNRLAALLLAATLLGAAAYAGAATPADSLEGSSLAAGLPMGNPGSTGGQAASGTRAPADLPDAAATPTVDDSAGRVQPAPSMTLYELVARGGPVMIPLALCSVLLVAVALERASALRRRKVLPPEFVENLRGLAADRPLDIEKIRLYCAAQPSPIARILQAAARRLGRPLPEIERAVEDAGAREIRLLRRGGRLLAGTAYVAPLLGLLGTAIGMIQCFMGLGAGESPGRSEFLATGLYQALVPTAAGLAIGIAAAIVYQACQARIEGLIVRLDAVAVEFIEAAAETDDDRAEA
jgi:biopolymer transport protein ExbB